MFFVYIPLLPSWLSPESPREPYSSSSLKCRGAEVWVGYRARIISGVPGCPLFLLSGVLPISLLW